MKNKHSLGSILTLLMSECDIDDSFLSKQTGIPISTLARLRTNIDSNPTAYTLRPIAKFFDISIDQLLGDEPLSSDRIPGTHIPQTYVSACLPILEWEWIDSWSDGCIEQHKQNIVHWISTEKKISEKAFALIVNTDSLGLTFRKGSLIIIEPDKKPGDGDLILIRTNIEEPIVLKQIITDGNEIYIKSVNPELKSVRKMPENHKFYGVLIEIRYSPCENDKKIKENNPSVENINFNFRFGKLKGC